MKQVDYVFRQLEYTRIDPTKTTEAWSEWIRQNYLSQGYEIFKAEVVRAEGNSVFVGIHFVKYEDEPIIPAVAKK